MTDIEADVAVIGAGMAGIATAYYLCIDNPSCRVVLIDSRQPMSYTSAQSGDNFRNWWPHQTMTAFTNDSIDELERLARDTDNVFQMRRTGYVLATRRSVSDAILATISGATDVDVIDSRTEIAKRYPALSHDVRNVVHIRRGGDLSGQQLGQYMLERVRDAGGRRIVGEVVGIDKSRRYHIDIVGQANRLIAETVVNAAGPFAKRIANMLGADLPVQNIYQQKIAFEDRQCAIPRDMPFTIDLDDKVLPWSDEERELLQQDERLAWLAGTVPSGTHCRPEGATWVKLGWAYNATQSEPCGDLANEPATDASFPEIVIRAAAQLIPGLGAYVDSPPRRMSHYGGYYTMTDENWPLVGPLDGERAFVVGALSGFGSMSACAAGKLCAAYVHQTLLPEYAEHLSFARYENAALMSEITGSANRGLL